MEEIKKIRTRQEIPVEDTWATEDMFATEELWDQTLASLEEDQKVLTSYAGKLGVSAQDLLGYLENMERVDSKIHLLGNYCMRKADEDTRNAHYQGMVGKFMALWSASAPSAALKPPRSWQSRKRPWKVSMRPAPVWSVTAVI